MPSVNFQNRIQVASATGVFTFIFCFGWLAKCSVSLRRERDERLEFPPEAWEVKFNAKGEAVDWQLKEGYVFQYGNQPVGTSPCTE
jgi:hypothetical protein